MIDNLALYFLVFFLSAVISFFISMSLVMAFILLGVVESIYFIFRELFEIVGWKEHIFLAWLWNPVVTVIVAGVTFGVIGAMLLRVFGGKK